jgi:hypothetical protein
MYLLKKVLDHLGLDAQGADEDLSEKYLEKAQTLLEKYGEALQVEGSDILPQSLLPGKPSEIKSAIKLHLALLPLDNEKQREKLKAAYAYLATFVPDAQALAFSQGDVSVKTLCAAEQQRLEEEIDAFCRDLPDLKATDETQA